MNGATPPRDGNRDPHMAPHGVFRAAGEDRWVAIAVEDDAEWRRLAHVIGQPELADDPRFATLAARKQHEDELEALVTSWTMERDPEAAAELLQAAGIAAALAARNRDLAEDAHLAARGFLVAPEHPEVGPLMHLGVPWRMSESDSGVRRPAPCLGEHTDACCATSAAMPTDEIARCARPASSA